jgi:hypothetical protein
LFGNNSTASTPERSEGEIIMLTGTISDLDTDGLFGLICSDDGRVMVFNLHGMQSPLRDQFTVGTRVEFVEQNGMPAQRAATLSRVIAS